MTPQYLLSLGANQQDPLTMINSAKKSLVGHELVSQVGVSSLWLSEPWGPVKQSWFVNQAVLIDSDLQPHQLLAITQKIEADLGRKREADWGPRLIDIDLIWSSSGSVDSTDLVMPHRFAHERLFVLAPWLELKPDAELAPHGLIAHLAENLTHQFCVPYRETTLVSN